VKPLRLLIGLAAAVILAEGTALAEEVAFAPGAEHHWNRLHRLLYVRTGQDGKAHVCEGPEAPLGREGPFLIDGPSHRAALALLDEFLRTDADRLVKDPLRRALLQRDLWYVFDKTAEPPFDPDDPEAIAQMPRRRALQKRLAQVMRRLELSPKEIAALPDNYAAAVKSDAFPRDFDRDHPDRAFLPPNLLGADSPWVPIRRRGRHLTAPEHTAFTGGRSVFVVLLRLPAGRPATEKYVKRLESGDGPPPFPAGTQVALLRRMMLANDRGALQVTPLVEELQLRTFPTETEQHVYELTLARDRLLAGKAGGLRALGPDDTDLFSFRATHAGMLDPFTHGDKPPEAPRLLNFCTACHNLQRASGGVSTMQSLGMGRQEGYGGGEQTDFAEQVWRTALFKRDSSSWGLLQGLRETGR
jgi:hypothetical protein